MNSNNEKKKKEPLTRFEKNVTIINIILVVIIAISAIWSSFDPLSPKSNTEVIFDIGDCNLTFNVGGDIAHWQIKIKNSGDDEANGIGLEIEFPEDTMIEWKTKLFTAWEGNWSRTPDYFYSKENYCVMRWEYLPAHCEIRVDLQIELPEETSDEKIYPNHIVVSAKGEKSPIFEYP